ncbi:hypothetical protein SYNTR_0989 [Candidatus Syntrophocurvum alkaliphilum]|uniref:Small-conductance mechanosensitive channel n=2 Tax=Candidatus Syntrophocurvum alkaliphilum TaxID=2293317 RepID=A0A6I6DF12_9FIRM|nr:hypothetical protein SYNTR_0989 [Candidatus Syntrophocurvum alkaliphilum]
MEILNNLNLEYFINTIINKYVINETIQLIIVAILIFLFFLILRKAFTGYIIKFLLRVTSNNETDYVYRVIKAYEMPLRYFFIFLGIYLALSYLPLTVGQDEFITALFRSSIVVLLAWGIYELFQGGSLLANDFKYRFNLDAILIPLITKVVRFIIIALVVVIIAQEWGYNVNGFIAGLGLGGLAFALAAQNTISNIFGGIVIVVEKPFSIGDWIKSPSVEGTVEDITFRSTRVRTFAQALVTVPNSTLADEPVTNWTKMGKRQITFHLGVTYTTPIEKLQKCVDRIEEMLKEHEDIHKETIFVTFETFNDSSLDIFLYFFTQTVNWGEYLKVREDVNFRIMQILEEEGVSIAFPTRSIYMENVQEDDKQQSMD